MAVRDVQRGFDLARISLAAYALLIVFASFRPFSGWRMPVRPVFQFLVAPFPRLWQTPDTLLNLLGYVPLGFLLVVALAPGLTTRRALSWSIGLTAGFSFLVETIQAWLPVRHSSLVDLIANTMGGAVGAIVAVMLLPWMARYLERGGWSTKGPIRDLGVLLIAIWLFSLLAPTTLLFGSGNLRRYLPFPWERGETIGLALAIEFLVTAANTAGLSLLVRAALMRRKHVVIVSVLVVLSALVCRTVSFGFFWGRYAALDWATPAAIAGVCAGMAGALWLNRSASERVIGWGALLLACGMIAVNVAPADARYFAQFPNVSYRDLARAGEVAAAGWPLMAICYLSWVRLRSQRRRIS